MLTQEQTAAKNVALAIIDVIRELGSVPNGHLYAHLMSKLSYDAYCGAITLIKSTGMVRESNNVLIWVGVPDKK